MVAHENGSRFGALTCSRSGGRGTHPDRRRAAGRRHARLARRGAPARARPAALPLPGHGHRLRRPGLDRLQRLPAGAPDRDHRAGPDPLRGRPDLGAARDPPGADAGAQPGASWARSSPRSSPAWRPRGSSTSRRSTGCCSARCSPPPTARRSSRCCAARRSSAAWRRRSRASRASTTRWRSCSCSASSNGCSTTTTGSPTWRCSSSASSGSASRSASWSGSPPRGRCGA